MHAKKVGDQYLKKAIDEFDAAIRLNPENANAYFSMGLAYVIWGQVARSIKDFIFVDPPYRPGERELLHSHYVYNKFSYTDLVEAVCLAHDLGHAPFGHAGGEALGERYRKEAR